MHCILRRWAQFTQITANITARNESWNDLENQPQRGQTDNQWSMIQTMFTCSWSLSLWRQHKYIDGFFYGSCKSSNAAVKGQLMRSFSRSNIKVTTDLVVLPRSTRSNVKVTAYLLVLPRSTRSNVKVTAYLVVFPRSTSWSVRQLRCQVYQVSYQLSQHQAACRRSSYSH